MPATGPRIGAGRRRRRSAGAAQPVYSPSLDFSDARNSMYL